MQLYMVMCNIYGILNKVRRVFVHFSLFNFFLNDIIFVIYGNIYSQHLLFYYAYFEEIPILGHLLFSGSLSQSE